MYLHSKGNEDTDLMEFGNNKMAAHKAKEAQERHKDIGEPG